MVEDRLTAEIILSIDFLRIHGGLVNVRNSGVSFAKPELKDMLPKRNDKRSPIEYPDVDDSNSESPCEHRQNSTAQREAKGLAAVGRHESPMQ